MVKLVRAGKGFTLMELVVSMGVLGLLMAAVSGVLRTHAHTYTREELSVAMEENLRFAMTTIKDEVRRAGYGLPANNLGAWIPWVSGFSVNPRIVQGSGTAPDRISVAACTSQPVATLASNAVAAAFDLSLDSTSGLDSAQRRLILIGDEEHAWVKSAGGGSITIDTNLGVTGNQGLSRGYVAGTPICRVDVLTFDVQTDPATGVPRLRLDRNQGEGPQPTADGIADLQITSPAAGRYRITLRAETEAPYPGAGARASRRLASDVTMKN